MRQNKEHLRELAIYQIFYLSISFHPKVILQVGFISLILQIQKLKLAQSHKNYQLRALPDSTESPEPREPQQKWHLKAPPSLHFHWVYCSSCQHPGAHRPATLGSAPEPAGCWSQFRPSVRVTVKHSEILEAGFKTIGSLKPVMVRGNILHCGDW